MVEPTQNAATPGEDTGKIPLDEPLDRFLDWKAKTIDEDGNRTGTYVRDLERIIPKWIETMHELGYQHLEELDGRALSKYANHLTKDVKQTGDDGISISTAWAYYDRISAYLQFCKEWEVITDNPAATAIAKDAMPTRQSSSSGDQQFWSPEQRKTLTRYVDRQAENAITEHGSDALAPVRDRALVYVIGYSGVRGAEVLKLSSGADARRTGATWGDLDLEGRSIEVWGKSQEFEQAPLTTRPVAHLERWEHVLDPPNDDWPIFPTLHLATLRKTAAKQLADHGVDTEEIDRVTSLQTTDLLEEYRERDLEPPSMTTAGARYVLKKLTEEAGVDVSDDPRDYLTLHGARRGVGEQYYRHAGPSAAQRGLRHADPSTTSEMYSHIEASELSDIGDEVFDE